jgi:predicted ribosome quality control (RQC) complex YloA/Tae2 family protein
VAVSYTLAKYVRKPRKAPAGLVTITNDKTLFVDP